MTNKNHKKIEYNVYLLPASDKELKKLPEKIQKQIMKIIRSLKYPHQVPAIKMGDKKNTFRVKSGNYRIVYKIYNKEVVVVIIKISHRKNVYK